MANTLFIKFNSLPLNPNADNLSFKYIATGGALTTISVTFGSGPGKCPIATNVNDQATNLATFLQTTYPTALIVPAPSSDTVTIVTANQSNISAPNQPVITAAVTPIRYFYETGDDGAPDCGALNIHTTVPNFPAQTIGAGTTIRITGYRLMQFRHTPNYGGNYTSNEQGTPNSMDYTFTIPQDCANISDAFNNYIAPSANWTVFANIVYQQYAMYTTGLPAGQTTFRFRMNGFNGCSGQWNIGCTQHVNFYVARQQSGGRYTTMSLTSSDTFSGTAKQIKLDTLDKVATFLSTDFLDLSGKNNQIAYRTSNNINFDDALTTPSIGPGTVVVVCKESITGGNPINSYEFGSAGGLNLQSYTESGWEWWNRSYLVRDSGNSGKNGEIYTGLVYLLSQQVDTGTSDPGTKAIDS
jgi:hypothetical protein